MMAGPRTDSLTAATLPLRPGGPSNWQGRRARPGPGTNGTVPVSESFKFAAQAATAVPSLCRGHCQYANYTAKTLSRMLVILALPLVTAPSGPRRPRTFVASVLEITDSDHDIHWQDHRRAVAARRRRGGVGGHRRGRRSGPGTGISSSSQAGNAARSPAGGRPGWPGVAARRGCQRCGRALSR